MVSRFRVAHDDRGFTMIELLTAMVIMGVTLGMVGMGATSWTRAREQSGSAQQLVSYLRQAQQRALTEATQYCVTFDTATSYAMHKGSCTDPVVKPAETDSPAVTIASLFTQADGSTATHIIFTPRGTASPGTATVSREGRDPIVLQVEGLTARVSID
jgi:type II secretion system protein H